MTNHEIKLPLIVLWDRPIEVSETEETSLAEIRKDLLDAIDAIENEGSPISSIITDIVQLILTGVEELAPAPAHFFAKLFGRMIARKRLENVNVRKIRRSTIEVLIRLLRPDLDYTMEISDVELVCRQVWGTEKFSNNIPTAIYDKVRFSLEGGKFWEYCNNKGLRRYLREKHRQVDTSYILYKNGSAFKRILKSS